ncbi:MAG TPA: DUF3375 family protein [Ramlibacter sp.]|nr:DUF3375 family protein [Ramlibacter sp.]
MPLDLATLENLRRQHPAWRLLAADSAPLVAAFLHRAFVQANVRSMAQAELAGVLEDTLFELRRQRGEDAWPRAAAEYLSDWCANERGWLRKFYPPGADEPHFELTPATEKALAWLAGLTERAFVGTESRLLTVFALLQEMSSGTETDPELRIADLQARRDAIDAELARVREGRFDVLGDTAVKERFQQFTALARELLADFREVEHNFRALDRSVRERITLWDGGKGALLQEIQFRRETRAVTRAGLLKAPGERHEKDDRHRIDDRSRYVLGWSNQAKIDALQSRLRLQESRLADLGERIAALQAEQSTHRERAQVLGRLEEYRDFTELDWQVVAGEIDRLHGERRALEEASDLLQALGRQLQEVEAALEQAERALKERRHEHAQASLRHEQAGELLRQLRALLDAPEAARHAEHLPWIAAARAEALGEHTLTVESCDNREQDMRRWLQDRIDAENRRVERLREKIVRAMVEYKEAWKLDTQEVDASVEADFEYRAMLERLRADDLPRFEASFKKLLNENTINEVANFQSQLAREREDIKDRVRQINGSLDRIDYNPGRYIVLEAQPAPDADIREFQQELRACTEDALTGSEDEQYSEAKFLQVKRIIERFRGRQGTAELDRRWTARVTDVRNWFCFAASERWREDGSEHEHYSDSGGKSGGQKEKLAYTVLAASLAYQFGLEWGASRSRGFRFVLIDEAFGRGSDESARYGLELFRQLNLQLLVVTPLQKIHIIEPYVASVGFVHNEGGQSSRLRNLTIEEYRAEREARGG